MSMQSHGGMKNWRTLRKTYLSGTLSTTSNIDWPRHKPRSSKLRGRWITTWARAWPISVNINLSSTPSSPKMFPPFRFSRKMYAFIPPSCVLLVCQSYPWFDYPVNTWWTVQILKLILGFKELNIIIHSFTLHSFTHSDVTAVNLTRVPPPTHRPWVSVSWWATDLNGIVGLDDDYVIDRATEATRRRGAAVL
jgi:hypothetical protein